MRHHDTTSPAEIADRHMQILAGVVLLVALKFVASAGMHLADGTLLEVLDWAELIAALTAMAVVVLLVISKQRKLGNEGWKDYFAGDGYLANAFREASSSALFVTWIVLVVLDIVAKNALADLPPRFFIQIVLAIMLGTLSIRFFLLSRDAH